MALPKEFTTVTPLSKTLAMIFFILFPFLGFYAGMQYQEVIDFQNQQEIAPETYKPHPAPSQYLTSDWKEFKDSQITFFYPARWKFFKNSIDGQNWYSIDEEYNNDSSKNHIVIDIRKKGLIIGDSTKNYTEEEIIENHKGYDMSSTADLGNYNPQQINKVKTSLDGAEGFVYTFQLYNNAQTPTNQATWIFLIKDAQLVKIKFHGGDKEIFEQILSTFQFTN